MIRVAGGVLIGLIALSMMRPSDAGPKKASAESSVAVVPLAIPLLARPGAISTVIILASRGTSLGHDLLVGAAIVAVSTIVLVAFVLAPLTESLVGKTGMRVLTRDHGADSCGDRRGVHRRWSLRALPGALVSEPMTG